MANGDFALVQVFDAKITEGASQLFELEDFAGVGLFVNAMERFDAAPKKNAATARLAASMNLR